jgi:hypothetical protein
MTNTDNIVEGSEQETAVIGMAVALANKDNLTLANAYYIINVMREQVSSGCNPFDLLDSVGLPDEHILALRIID